MFSWTRCALLLMLAALIAAPIAAAAEVHPSVFPSVLRGQGPWDVTYLVEFDSGPADERVVVSVSDGWGLPPDPTLSGPGKLTRGPSQLAIADRFCAGGNGAFSFESGGGQWMLDMPADTVNTLVFTLHVSHRFDVADTRLDDLRFSTAIPPAGYDITAQRQTTSLDFAPLALTGPELVAPRDAGISLSVSRNASKQIRPGERVALRGTASRLIAGQRIDLRAAFDPKPPYTLSKIKTPIASLRVRDDGSFGTNWRPRKAGRWTIDAVYDSHDPRFLDSETTGCYPIVQVRPR